MFSQCGLGTRFRRVIRGCARLVQQRAKMIETLLCDGISQCEWPIVAAGPLTLAGGIPGEVFGHEVCALAASNNLDDIEMAAAGKRWAGYMPEPDVLRALAWPCT